MILRKFLFIVPFYNCSNYLKKCFSSILSQKYSQWRVFFINDSSTEKNISTFIESEMEKDKRISLIFNLENKGALQNIVNSIDIASPSDEEIIILLDGDDWLSDNKVLEKLNLIYSEEKIEITYGNYSIFYGQNKELISSQEMVILDKYLFANVRNIDFMFSHLRTFTYGAWKKINRKNFLDLSGEFYRTTWDLAIMYPLIEMSSIDKIKYIDDILYIYNVENFLNDYKIHRGEQLFNELELRNKRLIL